jgi:hypothetical protein
MGGRAVYGMKEKTGKKILNRKLKSLPYCWRMAKSGTYDWKDTISAFKFA